MTSLKSVALVCAALAFTVGSALAQTPLLVHDAELAQGFGATKGQIVLVGTQILFVAGDDPTASLAIDRADVTKVDRSGDVVTVNTRLSLGDRNSFRFRLSQPGDLVKWYEGSAVASASPVKPGQSAVVASYQVKHDHRLGSCRGTLVLTNQRVAYESIDEINDSRHWQLVDIKEVDQKGAYKLEEWPERGRWIRAKNCSRVRGCSIAPAG